MPKKETSSGRKTRVTKKRSYSRSSSSSASPKPRKKKTKSFVNRKKYAKSDEKIKVKGASKKTSRKTTLPKVKSTSQSPKKAKSAKKRKCILWNVWGGVRCHWFGGAIIEDCQMRLWMGNAVKLSAAKVRPTLGSYVFLLIIATKRWPLCGQDSLNLVIWPIRGCTWRRAKWTCYY